jgi:hypothetical protein
MVQPLCRSSSSRSTWYAYFRARRFRAQHGDGFELAFVGVVPQAVEAGAVESGAAIAFVGVDMLRQQAMPLLLDPGAAGAELALNGLLAFLALSGDSGVEGNLHGRPPGDSNNRRYAAWRRWWPSRVRTFTDTTCQATGG